MCRPLWSMVVLSQLFKVYYYNDIVTHMANGQMKRLQNWSLPSSRVSSCLIHWWTTLYPWPSLKMVFVMDKLSSPKVKQKKEKTPLGFLITPLYIILSLPVWQYSPQLEHLSVLLPGTRRRTSTLYFCLPHKPNQQWETYPRSEGPG